MDNSLRIAVTEATEPYAKFTVSGLLTEAATEFNISVYGPRCAYARTLPTTFMHSGAGNLDVEFVIQDPCYWTPALPFLYELSVEGTSPAGLLYRERHTFGLRRLAPRRSSLYLESKRIVLRGMHVGSLTNAVVALVRDAEVSLVVPMPSDEELELASVEGIPIIVDLRGQAHEQTLRCLGTANYPSVLMAMLDCQQAARLGADDLGDGLIVVVCEANDPFPGAMMMSMRSLIAFELGPTDRPPAWAANCDRPVIAIRRGGAYADFYAARAACNELQAELAPEFDLAGYFV